LTTDNRTGPPSCGSEREMLRTFLDYQRATLAMKCDGLGDDELRQQSMPPSTLSLLGLVRHMAEVERQWFRVRFAGQDAGNRYQSPEDPDGDFNGAVGEQAVVDEAWAAWREEVALANEFIAEHDFDFVGTDSEGEPVSLREVLVHMIEEYARHNGHADIIRERIDGRVGE
jgi:uncharacterized damage-inducible protein DinB